MNKKAEIIPAILPVDFNELEDKVSYIVGQAKMVQIDICDGQFTPSASWPYKKHDDSFDKIVKEEIGMPAWEKIDYEFDLMVNHPEKVVADWLSAGASRIIIHAESKGDIIKAIEMLQGGAEVGLALNEDTPLSVIGEIRSKTSEGSLQFIQLMGIDRIGFQGQEFDDRVISKIKEAKKAHPHLLVSVDGGVSLENAERLIEAGADRLVVGSAIFGSENIIEALAEFKELIGRSDLQI